MIDEVFKRLFGDAILVRVRGEPRLRRILIEAFFYAGLAGVVFRIFLPLPVADSIRAILLLFGEAIAQVYLPDTHHVYTQWTELRRRTYLALFVYLAVRLLVGALANMHPSDTYSALQDAHGFVGILSGREFPSVVLFEVCFTLLFGELTFAAVFRHSRPARRALGIVAGTCAAALLLMRA